MTKIPIWIEKIKVPSYRSEIDSTEYLVTISEKGQRWDKSIRCSLLELRNFSDEIIEILNDTSTAEKLGITLDKGVKLDQHYENDPLNYKESKNCLTCIFELQSPLERKLFLALINERLFFTTQYPLNWKGENISIDGKTYDNPKNNFKEVLTVVDFYLEKKDMKLCVYTDGHTYHERTEEQAQRDKRIDRKLQELGFQVLRYTGKDVNDNTENIVSEIKKWLERPYK